MSRYVILVLLDDFTRTAKPSWQPRKPRKLGHKQTQTSEHLKRLAKFFYSRLHLFICSFVFFIELLLHSSDLHLAQFLHFSHLSKCFMYGKCFIIRSLVQLSVYSLFATVRHRRWHHALSIPSPTFRLFSESSSDPDSEATPSSASASCPRFCFRRSPASASESDASSLRFFPFPPLQKEKQIRQMKRDFQEQSLPLLTNSIITKFHF